MSAPICLPLLAFESNGFVHAPPLLAFLGVPSVWPEEVVLKGLVCFERKGFLGLEEVEGLEVVVALLWVFWKGVLSLERNGFLERAEIEVVG